MSASTDEILFEAVSCPSRSLSARGMRWLCALCLAAAMLPAGLFLVLGAWPVLGFMGLEMALVLGLMMLHRRWSARAKEVVRLTERRLQITVADGRGRPRRAVLEPYWARVALEEEPDGSARLAVVQRSRRVELGRFLSSDEKRELGAALAAALRRYREPIFDNPQLR